MTLISHPGSDYQMAQISIDADDILLMLTDAHAVVSDLAGDATPAAAAQAAACLRDADSPYTLDGLVGALSETVNWLYQARDGALVGIPPGS